MNPVVYEVDLSSPSAVQKAESLGLDPRVIAGGGHLQVVKRGDRYYAEYLTFDTWGPKMPKGTRMTKGLNWITRQLLDCRTPIDPQRLEEVLRD